ncbi:MULTISPECIES: hypothetical protein [unclassified Sphingomonas]|uniref:hypothetical protein n=1 Tax=unclassified Sphingomonas TaxID=196159 RepID=UPI0006F1E144|nr:MULTISPECIES: hypothetical protein [unclassified Sphingomonas]KQX23425.1 hypothetical protein ASD17_03750 [Sphingomonas sp. Root1294]KQY68276.1 hypothetical protein ASD39_06270 [Sphingomonas sp. Root50]KRB91176.1 hypothetical protein ASE22_13075 [Sphingomonas sp. Root720]
MTPTIYVEDWAPYAYLVKALFRVAPNLKVRLGRYDELDHPVVAERFLVSAFIAYRDELEPTFSFLSVGEALDRRFAELSLCGETPVARGVVRSLCQIIDEGHLMLAASHIGDLPGYDGPMWHAGSPAPDALLETYGKKMGIVERYATGDSFLLGPKAYLPDLIVAACIWYACDIGIEPIPDNCPKLQAWYRRNVETGIFRHPTP